MIFCRKKKESVKESERILATKMKQFQIEQLKKQFETNLHKDYKEALQSLVNELVYADLKENARNELPLKDQRHLRS